jgi:peptidoglycan/LPS O-acetylase OafA/YrhL
MLKPRSNLSSLTGLRFLAAFAIVVLHARGRFIPSEIFSGYPLNNAVSFFFILSGFILTYTYIDRPREEQTKRFLWARFARIWPIHLSTLILSLLLIYKYILHSKSALIANVMGIQAWIPLGKFFFSFNAVSWSISTEVGFYLLFPILVRNLKSTWLWKLGLSFLPAMALIAISAMLDAPEFEMSHLGISSTGFLLTNPLARLFEFVLGMSIASLWRDRRLQIERLGTARSTILEALAVAIFVFYVAFLRSSLLMLAETYISPHFVIWLRNIDCTPFFAAIIFLMAAGTGHISRSLGKPVIVFLGEASYCVYMLHNIIIVYLYGDDLLGWMPKAMQFLATSGIIVLVSAASYILVEAPARRWIMRFAFPSTRTATPRYVQPQY